MFTATREMTQQQLQIELYVRSLAPTDIRDRQESVIERLDELERAGRIDEFEVILCGDCVCASLATANTTVGQRLLDRFATFEEWAAQRDRTLVGFAQQDTKSTLSRSNITGIKFPRLALAEYRGGDLSFVAPSRNGAENTTVLDRIRTY